MPKIFRTNDVRCSSNCRVKWRKRRRSERGIHRHPADTLKSKSNCPNPSTEFRFRRKLRHPRKTLYLIGDRCRGRSSNEIRVARQPKFSVPQPDQPLRISSHPEWHGRPSTALFLIHKRALRQSRPLVLKYHTRNVLKSVRQAFVTGRLYSSCYTVRQQICGRNGVIIDRENQPFNGLQTFEFLLSKTDLLENAIRSKSI